ncbi:hypothetical protein LYB30171_00555 [Lysobacter luteus]|uniref:Porin n=2 Tax=Novilysobacter luteus TaxID=2822368 RepID=A0ABM8UD42_9GAMM|nr:hypothetical protein LYB30171_00555 [Lysobacter luteus]
MLRPTRTAPQPVNPMIRLAPSSAAAGSLALLLALAATPAFAADDPGWNASGDLRGGWFAGRTTARDGTVTDNDAFNARLRVAVQNAFADNWTARARVAGRFSSDQEDVQAYLRGYASTRTGTAFGDVTLDEAYLAYAAPDDGMRLRVGRFQTVFNLPGVAAKSLDRDDSPNTDVTWTDGVHLDMPIGAGWRGHAIAEHRHRRGTGVTRAPLDFSDSGSRVSTFLAVENSEAWGPVSLRMLSLTWMPSSLAVAGAGSDARDDYLTADARLAATWPVGGNGMKLVAGAELAYAFDTPPDARVGTGGDGNADGLAWQVAASLYEMAPGHNIGIAHGEVGAGWLISPDFRPNDRLTEVRYQWKFAERTSMEARVRERRELEHPVGTRARLDRDVYVRLSHRF